MTLRSIFCLSLREAKAEEDVRTPYWFWGAANRLSRISADKRVAEACSKVLGGSIPRGTRECISGSTNTANLVKQSADFKFSTARFLEADKPRTSSTKYRVVLIEEGLGNFGDAFYYTREALQTGVDVFNGLKIMADHPSADEEKVRPERTTRDILGHYENLALEEGANGCAWLCADVDILPSADCDWARSRMERAIENATKFPDKPFIGLSINAAGDAEKRNIDEVIAMAPEGAKAKLIEAKDNGIDLVKVVHKINHAVSCDLVTEAGAGGKIHNNIGETDGEEKAG